MATTEMKDRIEEILKAYKGAAVNWNVLINLMFLCKGKPNRVISQKIDKFKAKAEDKELLTWIEEGDLFTKIESTCKVLGEFLSNNKFNNWFLPRKKYPLFFIAYHIFHAKQPLDEADFAKMARFVHLSLLNKVFKERTKSKLVVRLYKVLCEFHSKPFPIDELLEVYRKHDKNSVNHFIDQINDALLFNMNIYKVGHYAQTYLFYLMYEGKLENDAHDRKGYDRDHIHAKLNLNRTQNKHTIANIHLLKGTINRGKKGSEEFGEWLNVHFKNDDVAKAAYLAKHLIPTDPKLWQAVNYDVFLAERSKLIVNKINDKLNK